MTEQYLRPTLANHEYGRCLDFRAEIALDIIVHGHALLTATDGGEDSAGRQKLANMSPSQMVNRAVETADLLVAAFEARGWIAPVGMTDDEAAVEAGRLGALRRDAEFKTKDFGRVVEDAAVHKARLREKLDAAILKQKDEAATT